MSSSSLSLTNLCFLGACNVFAVARCSTMALIISSKKNQEQSVTSFLVWSLDKVSCRASCSWTSFPRLVLPSAASAPRSPPGIISHFFGISSSDCTQSEFILLYLPWQSCDTTCLFQSKYKDYIICLYRKYTGCYHIITSLLLNSKRQ